MGFLRKPSSKKTDNNMMMMGSNDNNGDAAQQQQQQQVAPTSTATTTTTQIEQKIQEMSLQKENEAESTSYSFQYTEHDDLYGQVIPQETPEFISTKLIELETELQKYPNNEDKTAWNRALDTCPDLVCNDTFKLMFLRCEIFNTELAAKRIIKYWKKRLELFGQDKAFMPLKLGANGPFQNDDEALKIGFACCTHQRDDAGRLIMFGDPSRLPTDHSAYENESVCRAMWYTIHAALEDETTQRKGVIFIMFPKNEGLQFNRKLTKMNAESLKGCLPIRLSAVHLCHPPAVFDLIFPVIKILLGPHLRKKIRLNSGSDEKVLAKLENKFGIGRGKVPQEMGGKLVLDHEAWLEERLQNGD